MEWCRLHRPSEYFILKVNELKVLKIKNRSEDFPSHTGENTVYDEGRPDPDPVCPAKGYEEAEPGHKKIECQQEQHGGDHKPECRYDQMPGRLPPCLGIREKERECRDHRRRSKDTAIPGVHTLG